MRKGGNEGQVRSLVISFKLSFRLRALGRLISKPCMMMACLDEISTQESHRPTTGDTGDTG